MNFFSSTRWLWITITMCTFLIIPVSFSFPHNNVSAQSSSGSIILQAGGTLEVINLDDLSREILASNVIPLTVAIHPSENIVYFTIESPNRDFLLNYVDLNTFEAGTLHTLDAPGIVSGWSQDGAWLAITYLGAAGITVINADGTVVRDLVTVTFGSSGPTMSPDVSWLNDGTLLFTQLGDPTQVLQYYPVEDEVITFDVASDVVDLIDFDQLIMVDDLSLVDFDGFGRTISLSPDERVYVDWPRSVWELKIPICSTFQLESYNPSAFEQAEIIYQNDVTYLTEVQAVGDGTLAFLEWQFEDCSVANDIAVNLVHLDPVQSTHEIITSAVVPSTSSFAAAPLLSGSVLAVDTENNILYWLAGGLNDTVLELQAYNVISGETVTLLENIESLPGSHFSSIFWTADTITVPESWNQS